MMMHGQLVVFATKKMNVHWVVEYAEANLARRNVIMS